MPSMVTLYPCATKAVWICVTPDPWSPRRTLSLGLVTSRPGTVVVAPAAATEVVARTVMAGAVGTVLVPPRTVALTAVDVGMGTVVPVVGTVEPTAPLDGVSLLHAARTSAMPPQSTSEIRRCNIARRIRDAEHRIASPEVQHPVVGIASACWHGPRRDDSHPPQLSRRGPCRELPALNRHGVTV